MHIGKVASVSYEQSTNVINNKATVSQKSNADKADSIQKSIDQLKQQIDEIKKSDMSKDTKDSMIQNIESQIQELQSKLMQEKSNENTENNDEKDVKEESSSEEELTKKGFTVVNQNFQNGIAGVSSSMKLAKAARTQYVAAQGRLATAGTAAEAGEANKAMERSMNEQAKALSKAHQYANVMQKASNDEYKASETDDDTTGEVYKKNSYNGTDEDNNDTQNGVTTKSGKQVNMYKRNQENSEEKQKKTKFDVIA
ncbi:FlxA-like family protein [Clostridium oryzae]|uniref:FlxA-like protein n=1 Tax=Clostridium oryzae TaxID=1450648 RepID=A0A1V4IXS6_9CLOT|nr:FlxA-like family protein [Clostridium oryzae]OPJ64630.1 hypothetical protein CLORY_04990 [Clostridium oryzae]